MAKNLNLIGLAHWDFKGPERLYRLLNYLKPEVISLEIDERRVETIKKIAIQLKDDKNFENNFNWILQFDPNIETAAAYLRNNGFEYHIAMEYCQKNGIIPPILVDVKSREIMEGFEANIFDPTTKEHEDFKKYLQMSPEKIQSEIDRNYGTLARDIPLEYEDIGKMMERDESMVIGIKKLDGRIAHIGGLRHIYGNYFNLYHRLIELSPKRFTLNHLEGIMAWLKKFIIKILRWIGMAKEQDLLNMIDPSLTFDIAYTDNVYRVIQDGIPRILKFSRDELYRYQVMKDGLALRKANPVGIVVNLIKAYSFSFGKYKEQAAILKEFFDGYPLRKESNPELRSRVRHGINELNLLGIKGIDLYSPNIHVSYERDDVKIIELGGATVDEYPHDFIVEMEFRNLISTGKAGKELDMIELELRARSWFEEKYGK